MKILVIGGGSMICLREKEHLDHIKEECYLGFPYRGASAFIRYRKVQIFGGRCR